MIKKIRLGKGNFFYYECDKGSFDTFHGQCVLTTDISVEKYDGTYVKSFDKDIKTVLTSPKIIKRDNNYLEYSGEKSLEYAYKKALTLMLDFIKKGKPIINILVYKDACYLIDKKFKNMDSWFFKSIESETLRKKYQECAYKGNKAHNKSYGHKASIMQNEIIEKLNRKNKGVK